MNEVGFINESVRLFTTQVSSQFIHLSRIFESSYKKVKEQEKLLEVSLK